MSYEIKTCDFVEIEQCDIEKQSFKILDMNLFSLAFKTKIKAGYFIHFNMFLKAIIVQNYIEI